MSNTITGYDPIYYCNEVIENLEKALGFAARVYRACDPATRQAGSVVQIHRPSTFVAQDAPSSAQDLDTSLVQLSLSNWKEVKFALTDKEISAGGPALVSDHIRPAAYAIADAIDQSLCGLYADIPWYHDAAATAGVADITAVRKQMFDHQVPLHDPQLLHWMIDGDMEADFLSDSAFTQYQGAGQVGAEAQITGSLGQRYGFNFFANQNVASHSKGTLSSTTPLLVGAHAKGATAVTLDSGTLTGSLKKGDSFVLAGNNQRYAVTQDASATGNAITVQITPALVQAYADNTQATISLDDHAAGLAFHRNAFALVMAPLPDLGNDLGAKVATVADPITGLALRSRVFYDGNNSRVIVAVDALWGFKTLNPNLAVRIRN